MKYTYIYFILIFSTLEHTCDRQTMLIYNLISASLRSTSQQWSCMKLQKKPDIMIDTFPYLVLPYSSDSLFQHFLCLPAKFPGYTIVLWQDTRNPNRAFGHYCVLFLTGFKGTIIVTRNSVTGYYICFQGI